MFRRRGGVQNNDPIGININSLQDQPSHDEQEDPSEKTKMTMRMKKIMFEKRRQLFFGVLVVMIMTYYDGILRYLATQTTMYLVDRQLYPKPEGKHSSNFTFPSIEERVQYYMGSWYNHTNDYNGTDLCRDIPLFRQNNHESCYKDSPCIFDERALRKGRRRRIMKLNECTYEHDALKYYYHDNEISSNMKNIHNNSTINISDRRMIFQFGDALVNSQMAHPILVKVRASATTNNAQHNAPILALINEYRHYGQLASVRQYTPWNKKKDAIVFRGVSTGNRLSILQPFLRGNRTSGDYDFAFTKIVQQSNKNENENLLGNLLTTKQVTQYKYLLVLPGNDVSSGLKWMLYSDSVVFMPKPKKVSWVMEDNLVPYVHYIPVHEDLGDLNNQLAWARRNDELCRNISMHATQYMIDLYASEKAQRETNEIRRAIAGQYQMLYGPIISQCR
ncbi:hypothetical protein ACHAXR_004779 [Thalassiosira sp. AJA248-18]